MLAVGYCQTKPVQLLPHIPCLCAKIFGCWLYIHFYETDMRVATMFYLTLSKKVNKLFFPQKCYTIPL